MVDEIRISLATSTDISKIVTLHLHSFPDFFLTFLGPAFLRELYTATLEDDSGIGFVALNGEDILGFVTGTAEPSGFYRRLLRQRWWTLCAGLLIIQMNWMRWEGRGDDIWESTTVVIAV
jgi:hypothetical protein